MKIEIVGDRNLGEGFEYILEVDRTLKPTPAQVLEDSWSYLVKRPATPQERQELEEFVDFIRDPQRGKGQDSDMLRSQAARFDPVVRYLDWLADQETDSRERDRLTDMVLDRESEIIYPEGKPVNLMGHEINIDVNITDRLNLLRWLPAFLQGLGRRLAG